MFKWCSGVTECLNGVKFFMETNSGTEQQYFKCLQWQKGVIVLLRTIGVRLVSQSIATVSKWNKFHKFRIFRVVICANPSSNLYYNSNNNLNDNGFRYVWLVINIIIAMSQWLCFERRTCIVSTTDIHNNIYIRGVNCPIINAVQIQLC